MYAMPRSIGKNGTPATTPAPPVVEDVQRALERDDVGGVIAGDRKAGVARAAYDFVDGVEEGQDANLDGGAMWAESEDNIMNRTSHVATRAEMGRPPVWGCGKPN